LKIGISGHQEFHDSIVKDWVRESISNILKHFGPKTGITNLLGSADCIFAEEILRNKCALNVIIPAEETFEWVKYKALVDQAAKVQILCFNQPTERTYIEAIKAVVESSDYMIIVADEQLEFTRELQRKTFFLNINTLKVEFRNF